MAQKPCTSYLKSIRELTKYSRLLLFEQALNITEAIITGRVYRLFEYRFKEINLFYSMGLNTNNKDITVKRADNKLYVTFAGESAKIKDLLSERDIPSNIDLDDLERIYFTQYPVLRKIRDIFNHAYLPLNRSTHFENNIFKAQRNLRFQADSRMIMSSQDLVMFKVEELIRKKYSLIMSDIANINDEFRNEILKSLLSSEHGQKNTTILEVFNDFNNHKVKKEEILRIRDYYIKILTQLNILKNEEEASIRSFFEDFLTEYNKDNNSSRLSLALALQYLEIKRLKQLGDIVMPVLKTIC